LGEEDKPLDFADGDLFARVVVGEFGDAELVRRADRDRRFALLGGVVGALRLARPPTRGRRRRTAISRTSRAITAAAPMTTGDDGNIPGGRPAVT